MATEYDGSRGRGHGVRLHRLQRLQRSNRIPPHLRLPPETLSMPVTREVTEALPLLDQQGRITIVGAPFRVPTAVRRPDVRRGVGESTFSASTEQRTQYFVVANRPDKGVVDVDKDFSFVFNALYDEMRQPVGVSRSPHSCEEYAEDPTVRVLFPPKFYIRVHNTNPPEVVELFVLPTISAASEMRKRFEDGVRMPVMLVTPDGMPVPEEV